VLEHPSWESVFPTQIPARQTIHIWRSEINAQTSRLSEFSSLLACDELDRAQRFRFERDRIRYSTCRGLLRLLIGRYLGCTPAILSFRYSSLGKPYLNGAQTLSFNLSHSHEMVLYAFTSEGEVGVDIEKHDPKLEVEEIARNFFAPEEILYIRQGLPDRRYERFFHLWSRKEAFLKALATGLSTPLHQFEVSTQASLDGFEVCSFVPCAGFSAALAVRPAPRQISFFDADQIGFWPPNRLGGS
jgi:4'-phosphopantetheinyl transferase